MRQLAAIMFTDIVGYSALMGRDEQRAFDLLRRNRKIQRPLIKKYRGRWLKEIGDGVLASFKTVSDAVYCAGAIQKACLSHPDLSLRIGIHLGEVIFEGDDVFGDGVNTASRLEQLAPPGGILVSESVNNDLGNKKGIRSAFFTEKSVIDLKDPIKLYQVTVSDFALGEGVSGIRRRYRKSTWALAALLFLFTLIGAIWIVNKEGHENIDTLESSVGLSKSIAVLPFSDFSPENDQSWFSDGLTEELLNCLARLPELQVTARTSSFAFKGKDLPVQLIADSLGVNYLLEGSVRKVGNKLRVSAQLINPKQDSHVWSETYDRDLKDVFDIQEDIANNIAASLNVYLDEDKRNQMFAFGTRDPEAYQQYLQGNVLFDKGHSSNGTIHDLAQANTYYEEAIRADPDFAAPWYRHQDVYSHLLVTSSSKDWPDTLTKEQALETVLYDVNMARSKSKGSAETLFYEMEYTVVSNNWSKVPYLFEQLDANPQYLGPISHFGGGWSRSLFIALERVDLGLKIAGYQLVNDPLATQIDRILAEYLTAENQRDSAIYWSDKLESKIGRPRVLGLMLQPERAQEVIDQYSEADQNNIIVLFAKALDGDYSIPQGFESELDAPGELLMAAYIYSFIGDQHRADSIVQTLDSRFMGSFTISDRIIGLGGKIRFNLSATPNFATRLAEAGISNLDAYQQRHWYEP